jgi:hypothetical protein
MSQCVEKYCPNERAPKGDGTFMARCSHHLKRAAECRREARANKKRTRMEMEMALYVEAINGGAMDEDETMDGETITVTESHSENEHMIRKVRKVKNGDHIKETIWEDIYTNVCSHTMYAITTP